MSSRSYSATTIIYCFLQYDSQAGYDVTGYLRLAAIEVKQEAHQLVGQAKRRATKIQLEAVRCGIFDSSFKITPDQKEGVGRDIYPVWLQSRSVWMSL